MRFRSVELTLRYRKSASSQIFSFKVDYIEYMDKLASMVGCSPQPRRWLLRDPKLCFRLIFGPNAPYVYRLRGPHTWEGARNAIMAVEENTRQGLNGGSCVTANDSGDKY
jgi:dimethylaniline monooxygenase (N-oxide forming)